MQIARRIKAAPIQIDNSPAIHLENMVGWRESERFFGRRFGWYRPRVPERSVRSLYISRPQDRTTGTPPLAARPSDTILQCRSVAPTLCNIKSGGWLRKREAGGRQLNFLSLVFLLGTIAVSSWFVSLTPDMIEACLANRNRRHLRRFQAIASSSRRVGMMLSLRSSGGSWRFEAQPISGSVGSGSMNLMGRSQR